MKIYLEDYEEPLKICLKIISYLVFKVIYYVELKKSELKYYKVTTFAYCWARTDKKKEMHIQMKKYFSYLPLLGCSHRDMISFVQVNYSVVVVNLIYGA